MRGRRFGRFSRLACGLAIALMMALPAWVAAAPTPVGVGASTVFAGNGFSPNESLSFSEVGPDSVPVALGGAQTDGNGGFTFTVSFPSAGQWTVAAHSIASGKEVTGTYAVGSSTSAPTTTTTTANPAATTTTSGAAPYGTAASVGTPVSFTGNGFASYESISLWKTGPDSSVIALPGADADVKGAFGVAITFTAAGNWQITAHGKTTGKETIGRYAVGTGAVSAPTTATGTSTASGIAMNSAVAFSGSGFNADESISLWDTAPDATVLALPGINADGTGAFTTTVTFPSAGNWQVTAHGKDSGHDVIAPYTVAGDTTLTSTIAPVAGSTGTVSPVKTTTSTLVAFSPSGFTPGEKVSVWSTAPEGTVTALDSTVASANGRVVITASFASEGLWQLTAHGQESTHEAIGQYQVTART